MSWINLLQPDLIVSNSVLGITPKMVRDYGIKGLVLDVDETIIPIGKIQLDPAVRTWAEEIQSVVPLSLVSNNVGYERIRKIALGMAHGADVPFTASAGKPSRRKLRKAATAMDLPFEQIAMVGDRLFTDVLAGNRLGLFTILVQPMLEPNSKDPRNLLRNAEFWISRQLGITLTATL
ncbi:YqeG family HAD IIIA-type phosphatase [Leptolyngbya sp. BC1307]|uniref:YqeG family HAD IIIA-type phosphatase n=1 Tax=Leptolyngbya sp. BC1307 TaxID=2029589 RepID=UPI000EFA6196|nr:YqeG family HAD IIIA-type phosphatase [Leptolyngbya sp. BC1307]